jgi:hypothetical protein
MRLATITENDHETDTTDTDRRQYTPEEADSLFDRGLRAMHDRDDEEAFRIFDDLTQHSGEFQQPLPGLGVARHGPRQLSLKDGGRIVAHGPRSLLSGRRALRFSLSQPGTVVRKNARWRCPLGRLLPG